MSKARIINMLFWIWMFSSGLISNPNPNIPYSIKAVTPNPAIFRMVVDPDPEAFGEVMGFTACGLVFWAFVDWRLRKREEKRKNA